MSIEALVLITVAIAVGAVAKGATGLGLPLVAVPVMAGFFGVQHAVVVMVLPLLVTNLWLVVENRRAASALQGVTFWLAIAAVGAVVGTWLLAALPGRALLLMMGAWLGFYLFTHLLGRPIRLSGTWGDRIAPGFCFLAGVMQGANGISGPLVATFFHARNLEPRVYLFVVSAMFLVLQIAASVTLGVFGLLTKEWMTESLIALVPSLLGLPIGVRLGRAMSPKLFNRAILALLFVMEAKILYEGLAH